MTDDKAALLPCPFCGEAGVPAYRGQPATELFIGCGSCQATGPQIPHEPYGKYSWNKAIAAWNTRAALPRSTEGWMMELKPFAERYDAEMSLSPQPQWADQSTIRVAWKYVREAAEAYRAMLAASPAAPAAGAEQGWREPVTQQQPEKGR